MSCAKACLRFGFVLPLFSPQKSVPHGAFCVFWFCVCGYWFCHSLTATSRLPDLANLLRHMHTREGMAILLVEHQQICKQAVACATDDPRGQGGNRDSQRAHSELREWTRCFGCLAEGSRTRCPDLLPAGCFLTCVSLSCCE